MKKLIIMSFILSGFFLNVYSQSKGYKDIQIGKTLAQISVNKQYEIYGKQGDPYFYIQADSLKICEMDIKYIRVKLDKDGVIDNVGIQTVALYFKDYNQYYSNLQGNLAILNNAIGTFQWTNLSKPVDGKVAFAWSFKNDGTELFIQVDDVSSFANNFERFYTFNWIIANEKKIW